MTGGAMSVSAAQNIFTNCLIASLRTNSPGLDPSLVLSVGATEIRAIFAPDQIIGILSSYMTGLRAAWALGIGLAGGMVVASLLADRISIKKKT